MPERAFQMYRLTGLDLRELTKGAVHEALFHAGVDCHRPGGPLCSQVADELIRRMSGREEKTVPTQTQIEGYLTGPEFRWFAWHPVRTTDRGWRWLRMVWKRRVWEDDLAGEPTSPGFWATRVER